MTNTQMHRTGGTDDDKEAHFFDDSIDEANNKFIPLF